MADDTGYKVVSPDEWRRSFAAKRASVTAPYAGYRKVSPEEWSASLKAKRSASTPSPVPAPSRLGQVVTGIASLAPTMGGAIAGAETGAEAGSILGIPGALAGGLLGAGIGGLATPATEYFAKRATGQPAAPPTYGQAAEGFKTGVESEMLGQAGGAVVPYLGTLKRAFTGESEIGEAATKAGEEAEGKGIAEKAKLRAAATTEAAGQKKVAAKAAEKAGQAGLFDREEMYRQAQAARSSMTETAQTASAKADQAIANARTKLGKAIEPEARQEAIANALPPPRTGFAESDIERAARHQQLHDTAISPLTVRRQAWAESRDVLLKDHMNKAPDLNPLYAGVAQEKAHWLPGHAPYSPQVADVLDDLEMLGKPPKLDQAVADVIRGGRHTDPETKGRFTSLLDRERSAQEAEVKAGTRDKIELTPDRLREIAIESLGYHEQKPVTVADLITKQSMIGRMARAARNPADRTALENASRAIDDTLVNFVPTPELKALNSEYAAHRRLFPPDFESKIRNAATPLEVTKDLFDGSRGPERISDLVKWGGEDTKGSLAQLLSDHIKENGGRDINPNVVKQLGYPGPLSKPESWFYANNAVDRLGEMLQSTPQASAKWTNAMNTADGQARDEEATSILKDARSDLMNLGPLGKRIQAQIDSAPTLKARADIAVKALSNLQPEQAVSELAATQAGAPGRAAFGAASQFRQEGGQAARQAMRAYQAPSPEEAGVKAITEFKPKGGIIDRWKRRAEFWVPLAAAGAVVGHPSTYAMGGLMMGGPIAIREAVAAGYRQALRHPQTAVEFYRALQNPGTPEGLKTLAKYAVQAAFLRNAPTDVTAPTPSKGTNPVIKSADTKRIETIAGPHADATRLDNVKTVSEKIARPGKPANVDLALKTGRVSIAQVRDMLDAGGNDLSSIFKGLSMQDSIDTLAKASSQEREMFLPVIAQKIQDEAKGKSPQEQQFLVAQLKAVMGEAA